MNETSMLYRVDVSGTMYVLAKSMVDAESVARQWFGEETAFEFAADLASSRDCTPSDVLDSIPWGDQDGELRSVAQWLGEATKP